MTALNSVSRNDSSPSLKPADTIGNPLPVLSVENVSKAFAAPVLNKVSFDLYEGEVHALMGSNGAGKSTLCNIIAGLLPQDSGILRLRRGAAGESQDVFSPASVAQAERHGVYMVMQELSVFPTLIVAENIAFKHLSLYQNMFGQLNRQKLNEDARRELQHLGLGGIDSNAALSTMGVGNQQLVEIARALTQKVRVLILDEPTAMLTDVEIDKLFARLKTLQKEGMSIIYISHRMNEIAKIANRVSVLRDGVITATFSAEELNMDSVLNAMATDTALSGKVDATDIENSVSDETKPYFRLQGISGKKLKNISLEIPARSIVGLGGLVGSGRSEILSSIFGVEPVAAGDMQIYDEDKGWRTVVIDKPADAIAEGIAMVVEDRKESGLLLARDLELNIALGNFKRYKRSANRVDLPRLEQACTSTLAKIDTRFDSLKQSASSLSGGNQQKVLLSRWLVQDYDFYLIDEPGRGVDAAAKEKIYALIRQLRHRGATILVVSSETQELLSLCDYFYAVSNGHLDKRFYPKGFDEADWLDACFRHY